LTFIDTGFAISLINQIKTLNQTLELIMTPLTGMETGTNDAKDKLSSQVPT
jgi:hypothetical protein